MLRGWRAFMEGIPPVESLWVLPCSIAAIRGALPSRPAVLPACMHDYGQMHLPPECPLQLIFACIEHLLVVPATRVSCITYKFLYCTSTSRICPKNQASPNKRESHQIMDSLADTTSNLCQPPAFHPVHANTCSAQRAELASACKLMSPLAAAQNCLRHPASNKLRTNTS